ncbi:hypothetical protein [Nonomuraea africana]|uniref:Secreted protein n=1 Tax=Nonomuraea africana TaxID=46171 RepID=A0ABR9KL11_9ACTN|nr:hypothetical protein [Nonomuraea africana]MBE1562242.1 hypothetical protein [Nonomuraea africana]
MMFLARRTVPGRIKVISSVTVAALGLLFATLAYGTAAAREGLRVIGHDAGPQVVATAGLYLGLSDMDAQVANALLLGDRRQDALARYERRRAEVGSALLQAHTLAGADAAERRTIASVLEGLGRYERLAAEALLLSTLDTSGSPESGDRALATYRQATDLMTRELLPQAYNLTLESGTIVRHAYEEGHSTVVTVRLIALLCGALALGCLVWLQIFLARRFRRVFGLALMAASLATAACGIAGAVIMEREAASLATAKRDSFDSVLTLARARAISNSLHADQSRYLLDGVRADTYQHTFFDKSQSLVYVTAKNLPDYQRAVVSLKDGRFLGMLEGRDVTTAWQRFQQSDRSLRAQSGASAIATLTGPVRSAFDAYDATLVRLADQHRATFARAIADGEGGLSGLWTLIPAGIAVIAGGVLAGVWPRLKEYR